MSVPLPDAFEPAHLERDAVLHGKLEQSPLLRWWWLTMEEHFSFVMQAWYAHLRGDIRPLLLALPHFILVQLAYGKHTAPSPRSTAATWTNLVHLAVHAPSVIQAVVANGHVIFDHVIERHHSSMEAFRNTCVDPTPKSLAGLSLRAACTRVVRGQLRELMRLPKERERIDRVGPDYLSWPKYAGTLAAAKRLVLASMRSADVPGVAINQALCHAVQPRKGILMLNAFTDSFDTYCVQRAAKTKRRRREE